MDLYWYIIIIVFIIVKVSFYICWYRARRRHLAAFLQAAAVERNIQQPVSEASLVPSPHLGALLVLYGNGAHIFEQTPGSPSQTPSFSHQAPPPYDAVCSMQDDMKPPAYQEISDSHDDAPPPYTPAVVMPTGTPVAFPTDSMVTPMAP
uniref:Uncharacterized protein n=1 Tax=Eptatretus burgeri TaxID=7764 RepID=A0A8C4QCM7_EPTBU